MNWPPMLLHLEVPTEYGCRGLWLPLFLVYPVLLVVSLILLPFLLLGAFVLLLMGDGKAAAPVLVIPYIWNIVFKTRGLTVNVKNHGHDILINFV